MTALLTRLRPTSSHGLRIRLPHRAGRAVRNGCEVFAEAQERLATRSEIERLRSSYSARRTSGV